MVYLVNSGIISFENIQFATDEHSIICVFNILSISTVSICWSALHKSKVLRNICN